MKKLTLIPIIAALLFANVASAKVVIVEESYDLGQAQVHSRNMIPTEKNEVGTFDIEYEIKYTLSNTFTVAQETPGWIFLDFTIPYGAAAQIYYEVPREPANGGSWCGARALKITCAVPVELMKSYRFHLTYSKQVDNPLWIKFDTSYNNGPVRRFMWPLFNTDKMFLPQIKK